MQATCLFVLLLAAGVSGMPARAQPAATDSPPAAAAPALDARAIDALQRMGRYLQSLSGFQAKVRTLTDQVLDDGQKIQFEDSGTIWIRRPDRLRFDTNSDRRTRQFFYDGKQLTIYGRRNGYYARVPAPPTLKELVAAMEETYDLELPLVDLFTWGSDPEQLAQLTGASAIGLATVNGKASDQYVFRQDGLDWQLWIQRGDRPLPLRLVLTTTDDPARPQFSADLDWSLDKPLANSLFTFVPPAGAHQIAMRRADGTLVTPLGSKP